MELEVHRSQKHPALGHVIVVLHPCGHRRRLGLTRWDKSVKESWYRTQSVKLIKIEVIEVTDKEHCYKCPELESWLGDEPLVAEVLEHLDLVDEIG